MNPTNNQEPNRQNSDVPQSGNEPVREVSESEQSFDANPGPQSNAAAPGAAPTTEQTPVVPEVVSPQSTPAQPASSRLMIIVLAFIVTLLLAAVAVAMYLGATDTDNDKTVAPSTQQSNTGDAVESINAAAMDLDAALRATEAAEAMNEADLSDETLNL